MNGGDARRRRACQRRCTVEPELYTINKSTIGCVYVPKRSIRSFQCSPVILGRRRDELTRKEIALILMLMNE